MGRAIRNGLLFSYVVLAVLSVSYLVAVVSTWMLGRDGRVWVSPLEVLPVYADSVEASLWAVRLIAVVLVAGLFAALMRAAGRSARVAPAPLAGDGPRALRVLIRPARAA